MLLSLFFSNEEDVIINCSIINCVHFSQCALSKDTIWESVQIMWFYPNPQLSSHVSQQLFVSSGTFLSPSSAWQFPWWGETNCLRTNSKGASSWVSWTLLVLQVTELNVDFQKIFLLHSTLELCGLRQAINFCKLFLGKYCWKILENADLVGFVSFLI